MLPALHLATSAAPHLSLTLARGFLGLEDVLSQGIAINIVIVIIIIITPAFFCSELPFLTGGFVSRASLLPQRISCPCSPSLGLEGCEWRQLGSPSPCLRGCWLPVVPLPRAKTPTGLWIPVLSWRFLGTAQGPQPGPSCPTPATSTPCPPSHLPLHFLVHAPLRGENQAVLAFPFPDLPGSGEF